MPRGYDRPLYILPFDHRGSLETKMFGWSPPLNEDQIRKISDAKQIVYEGFTAAVAGGVDHAKAAILVDEEFGAAILHDAWAAGFVTAAPAEQSGKAEFEFEYGEDFARHIEAFDPTFCKVLVRYNPEGDRALNARQAGRLRRLSDYLQTRGAGRLMFELLLPPEKAQLDKVAGDRRTYDLELRPGLMVRAIEELQAAGVEPDVWKVEGLDHRADCERIVAAARAGGRQNVACIVLGRGENPKQVDVWLATAARVDGFVGFAVGRTVFWEPLTAWLAGAITRQQAAAEMAARYRGFVDAFESAKPSLDRG